MVFVFFRNLLFYNFFDVFIFSGNLREKPVFSDIDILNLVNGKYNIYKQNWFSSIVIKYISYYLLRV
jgi:hypothetical protein